MAVGQGPLQIGLVGSSAIARLPLLGGHHFVLELVLSADVVVGYAEYEVRGSGVGVLARPLGGPLCVRHNRNRRTGAGAAQHGAGLSIGPGLDQREPRRHDRGQSWRHGADNL